MTTFGYLLPTRGIVFSSTSTTELTARADADIVGLAQRAESLGYDSAWVGDSVLAKPRLEPLVTLGAISAATESIGVGTAVYLPVLRHPVHVAHMTATLDQLSGGRLSLGVRPPEREEMRQLGIDDERRGATLNEALAVVSELWKGATIDYDGDHYSLEDAAIGFEPARKPPIYVASAAFDPSSGFPGTIRRRLTNHGDGWLPIAMAPETYAGGLDHIRELLVEAGRPAEAITPGYYLDVIVADSESEALDDAREFYHNYYGEQITYQSDRSLSDAKIRKRGAFGTPAAVESLLADYIEAGVEQFVVRFPTTDQRRQLGVFSSIASTIQ
ncbi:LLM class flavin-dependent oxidoreductase [Halalkalicoccus jeotgali]|uniref:LLM class flavin-dependent oxidoreductase n=1 Tax=Halalkalicoccus jeotgali TaxID=413810 RepID=UPI000677BD8B|nr:LLM class flavin-dependent oxidoreductase [Halalkalicoccus jeotgali]